MYGKTSFIVEKCVDFVHIFQIKIFGAFLSSKTVKINNHIHVPHTYIIFEQAVPIYRNTSQHLATWYVRGSSVRLEYFDCNNRNRNIYIEVYNYGNKILNCLLYTYNHHGDGYIHITIMWWWLYAHNHCGDGNIYTYSHYGDGYTYNHYGVGYIRITIIVLVASVETKIQYFTM